jgi:hypothetical protein
MINEQKPAPWEEQLRQGLDLLSDPGAEAAPDVADLQLLVARVQAEQRQSVARDLILFWLCALAVLSGALYLFSREPVFFLALQAALAVCLISVGVVWAGARGRVAP